MNSEKDTSSSGEPLHWPQLPNQSTASPQNWKEALVVLLDTRTSLVRLEAREAARAAVKRLTVCVAMILCAFFTWALLLTGTIAMTTTFTGWPWHWVTLGFAAAHLLATLILGIKAKKPAAPLFPITRGEFKKDREWILKL